MYILKCFKENSNRFNLKNQLTLLGIFGFLTACSGNSTDFENLFALNESNTQQIEPKNKISDSKISSAFVERRSAALMPSVEAFKTAVAEVPLPRGGGHNKIGAPYKISGQWYYPKANEKYSETGVASWYGHPFHGQKTSNGEIYDMNHLTAAHRTMPLPSYARVTNLANGASMIVRVNDRGPFAQDRIIDLSRQVSVILDSYKKGVAQVRVDYIGPAPLHADDDAYLWASYKSGNINSESIVALASKKNDNLANEANQQLTMTTGIE